MGCALSPRRRKGYQGRSPWLVCDFVIFSILAGQNRSAKKIGLATGQGSVGFGLFLLRWTSFDICNLLYPFRIQPRFHLFSGPKERNALSWDRNRGPSPGISAAVPFPQFYKEHPEAPQFDPVTTGHGGGNLCKNDIDDLLGVLPMEMRVLSNTRSISLDLITSNPPASEGGADRQTGRALLSAGWQSADGKTVRITPAPSSRYILPPANGRQQSELVR